MSNTDRISTERASCDRQTHNSEPSSRRIRRSIRIVTRHQGIEGASTRPQEGEEHQALKVYSAR